MATRLGSATVTLPSDTQILITRSFEAPRWLVWEVMTTPRHLLRWWGPDWCPLVACELDLRPGGDWRYVCRMLGGEADGSELSWYGTYREIEPPVRLVTTEVFEGFPDAVAVNTVTLTEADGVTTLETVVTHSCREHRDGHVASGMEGGMQVTMDRLDALLARRDTAAERFRRVAGTFADVLASVPADGWDAPTPCTGWSVRDVPAHLVAWVPSVIGRSGLDLGGGPNPIDDPVGAWGQLATALQAALEDPEVAARTFDAGPPGEMTVEDAVDRLVTNDILVHTWDVAAGIGVPVALDAAVVHDALVGMVAVDELLRSSGHYGPKVTVAPDAPEQDRLIAFTGRDPGCLSAR